MYFQMKPLGRLVLVNRFRVHLSHQYPPIAR